jgi:hypothetical protein
MSDKTCQTCVLWVQLPGCNVSDEHDPGMNNEVERGACRLSIRHWPRSDNGMLTTTVLVTGPEFGCVHHLSRPVEV